MSSSYFLQILILLTMIHSLPLVNATAISCPPQNFTCGNIALDIVLPFFTNKSSSQCTGLHYIDCMNFVPTVSFKGISYLYPVADISFHYKTITIYDPNLSSYFRGSDCVFLYDFRNPVPDFAFNSSSVSPNPVESFFNCKSDHDVNPDIFRLEYNLSLCKDYSLHYSGDYGHQNFATFPSYCSNSSDLWFYWKLSFGGNKEGGEISLLAAGFLPRWVQHRDCFSCEFSASHNCSGVAEDPTCSCNSSCQGKKKNKKKKEITIGMSVTAGVLLISILCFIGYWRHHRRQQKQQRSPSSAFLSDPSTTTGLQFSDKGTELTGYPCQIHIFTYDELLDATNSFDTSMEIGDGGFGTVYKGLLFDGRTVAVKRFHESNFRRAEQFANEIVILSRFRHNNLVSLYGCTSPRSSELLLVYEYIPNGTVADHLFGPRAAEGRLTWPRRLSIAVETAAALAYLHAVDPPIIHRDVKTGNILLDTEFHVKVTDFGLSRHFPRDGVTHISSAPQGTPGYLDPEYYRSYQLTDRSDVYSFGVVLAELISSKPAVDIGRDRAEINLSTMAVNRIQSGNLEDLVDRKLGYESDAETTTTIRLVAELTFRCLQADREMRPAIKEVLQVLEGLQKGATFDSEKMEHFVEEAVGNAGVDMGAGAERPVSPDSVTENWVTGVLLGTT